MKREFFDPDSVHDRDSFMQFVEWLCADREASEDLESSDPERFRWGGANNWQNSSISTFLEAAAAGADSQKDWGNGTSPSWKDLAVFLYLGKIYE